MNRIRSVSYYYYEEVPSSWLTEAVVGRFIRQELQMDQLLGAEEIFSVLKQRCLQAFSSDIQQLQLEAVEEAIGGMLVGGSCPLAEVDNLVLTATQGLNAALERLYGYMNHRLGPLDGRAGLRRWNLGNALMPFTDTSLPVLAKVRQCWCACWVRDGDTHCPFCFARAPRGRPRRAWERVQVRIQQQAGLVAQPPVPVGVLSDLLWDDPEVEIGGPDGGGELEEDDGSSVGGYDPEGDIGEPDEGDHSGEMENDDE